MAGSTSSSTSAKTRQHNMRFGTQITNAGVKFNLWAPSVESVELCLNGKEGERNVVMEPQDGGWFAVEVAGAKPGDQYQFLVNDLKVPDPVSRHQVSDVHGPSEVIDAAKFEWKDQKWKGLPWEQSVIYELHVGTFTPKGTFLGVIEKLDYLKSLGITAVELMPISDFPGKRNWGYDGVLHFAPDSAYGTPDDLKALVSAAHERGMMIFLDVVYNHFGPEGNYLYVHSKPFFTEKYKTPWGAAIDFEGAHSPTVRRFFIDNALYWINEFRFDGLRFDAVHAIYDESEKLFLEELAESIRREIEPGRYVHLVLENDDNNAKLLEHDAKVQPKHFTAQWNDDYHHCVHVLATKEETGYYADYAGGALHKTAAETFARALAEGFAYQGEPSKYRAGEKRGQNSAHLPSSAFVSFMQNHDQVGNRAFAERIAKLAPTQALRAVTSITLLSPQIPMLFMGEEWASTKPFYFFCDFGEDLCAAVREGRRQEFAQFPEFQDEKKRELIPDPTAEQTFNHSVLDWNERDARGNSEHLEFVRSLIALRQSEVVPLIAGSRCDASWRMLGDTAFEVRWQTAGGDLVLVANLGDTEVEIKSASANDKMRILHSLNMQPDASQTRLYPWSVTWSISNAK